VLWKGKSLPIQCKGLITIVRITKEEAAYLRSQKRGGYIAKTANGKHYVTEEPRTLDLLRKFRNKGVNGGKR